MGPLVKPPGFDSTGSSQRCDNFRSKVASASGTGCAHILRHWLLTITLCSSFSTRDELSC